MPEIGADRFLHRRDPRVRISGRLCHLCKSNAPVALVLNLVMLNGQVFVCVACIVRASYQLAAREDVVINLNLEPGGALNG